MKLRNLHAQFHLHTVYSLIDSVSDPDAMVKHCVEVQNTQFIGITDHGNMSGLYHMDQACEKYGAKSIWGCEFYVDLGADYPKANGHLTTLAYNDIGKKNLLYLFHKSWDNVQTKWGKKKAMITWDLLREKNEGLFVGTGCIAGVTGKNLLNNRLDLAERNLDWLIEIFGKDNVFAEFIPHSVTHDYNHKTGQFEPNECKPWCPDGDLQKGYNLWLWDNAVIKRGLRPVITSDAHFTTPDKHIIQTALLQNGQKGWSFMRSHDLLTPEIMYNNLIYLPNFNESVYTSMVENAKFFTDKLNYAKQEKKIHLAFEFKTQEESLEAFASNVKEDRLNKICDCHE